MRFIAALAFAFWLLGIAASEAQPGGSGKDKVVGAYRVLVADADGPTVRIVDLESAKVLASYMLGGPARLHRGASGRYVYAAQEKTKQIAILDTGIAIEGHGDHSDIKISRPRLLPVRLHGPRPSHIAHGGDRVAAFFDGDGSAQVIREAEFAAGKGRPVRLETGASHHGVAQPVGRHIAITVPPGAEGLPSALELRSLDRKSSSRIDCPRLHGNGITGRFVAFGCADGVVIAEDKRDAAAARRLAYPEQLPSGRMVRNIAGATGFSFFAGDFGADGMVVFSPTAADGDFRFIELPGRRIHFNLHPEPGDRLYVMVEDGSLISINPLTGAVEAKANVTARYSMEQGVIRPRVTSAGPYVVVSNPAAGEIVILDSQTLAERKRLKMEGAPADVIAVGGRGSTH